MVKNRDKNHGRLKYCEWFPVWRINISASDAWSASLSTSIYLSLSLIIITFLSSLPPMRTVISLGVSGILIRLKSSRYPSSVSPSLHLLNYLHPHLSHSKLPQTFLILFLSLSLSQKSETFNPFPHSKGKIFTLTIFLETINLF